MEEGAMQCHRVSQFCDKRQQSPIITRQCYLEPRSEKRQPRIELRQSRFELRQPRFELRQPRSGQDYFVVVSISSGGDSMTAVASVSVDSNLGMLSISSESLSTN